MPELAPHFVFPLRFAAGRFVAVEQGSQRHREDQAEVALRTRPGTFDHDPDFGLRDLTARSAPAAPEVLKAVGRVVDGSFEVTESRGDLTPRVRDVSVRLRDADAAREV